MAKKWHQYVGIRAAIIIAAGGIIVAGMNIWHDRSELKQNNEKHKNEIENKEKLINELNQQLSQKHSEIQHLETQLTPFKTIALEKFTGDENERLRKLAQEIENLQKDIIAIRDYSDMASLNALGKPHSDGDIVWNTAISRILEGTWEKRENQFVMRRDKEAEEKYREVIQKFPKFPFAYYFLALCLKYRGDEEWEIYAKKAVEILEITTTISGHKSHHDDVLQKLYRYLNETQ